MNRKTLSIAVIALQVCFFVGWYMVEAQIFDRPIATIKVKPQPYDPRDLLSGQYMRLNYDFSRPMTFQKGSGEYDVWVVLQKGSNGFYTHTSASLEKPKDLPANSVAIVGEKGTYNSTVWYGIEKYFVKEGTREPSRADTTIKLDVYESGKVRINTLLVKGKEWP